MESEKFMKAMDSLRESLVSMKQIEKCIRAQADQMEAERLNARKGIAQENPDNKNRKREESNQ